MSTVGDAIFMSKYSINEGDLILATLSNHLKLNKSRLDQVLKCYPDITKAVEDKFEGLFKYTKSEPEKNLYNDQNFESDSPDLDRVFKQDTRWLSKVKNFEWFRFEDHKQNILKDLELYEIGIIGYLEFPPSLLDLCDYPLVLYFQGDKDILSRNNLISIVGSRMINHYASKFLTDIVAQLEGFDFGIVSGLALGVDSLAHQLALKHNHKCLAFIGSGHDEEVFYPTSNLRLKKQIIDSGGLVCSEYPPGFRSMPYTFHRRNRFVASISYLTWVAQASQKSGALITAKLALEYGKIVATTPASIFDTLFEGNLSLMRDGAQIVANADDLLGLLNLSGRKLKVKTIIQDIDWSTYSNNAKIIYDSLSYEPKEIQEIFMQTKIPIAVLGSELSMLELNGLASNIEFGKWVKN